MYNITCHPGRTVLGGKLAAEVVALRAAGVVEEINGAGRPFNKAVQPDIVAKKDTFVPKEPLGDPLCIVTCLFYSIGAFIYSFIVYASCI